MGNKEIVFTERPFQLNLLVNAKVQFHSSCGSLKLSFYAVKVTVLYFISLRLKKTGATAVFYDAICVKCS